MSLGKALLSVLFSLTITCMAKIGCLKKPVLNIFWLSVIEIKAGLFMMIITCSSARQHRLLTQSTLTSCMSTIFISLTTRIQNKLNNMNGSLNVFLTMSALCSDQLKFEDNCIPICLCSLTYSSWQLSMKYLKKMSDHGI